MPAALQWIAWEPGVRLTGCPSDIPKWSKPMVPKNLLALVILLVALGLAAWFYYFVDAQTEQIEPAETSDSTG